MDPADALLDKIFSLVDLEERSADELDKLASELEGQRKPVKTSQVVGSAASVVGSAALITAGVLTGGAAAFVLAVGGAVVLWLVLGAIVGSGDVDGINPKIDEKEKKIYKEIENLSNEIQTLTKSLAGEGKKAGVSEDVQEKYITERILRALAKRHGLILYPKVSSSKLVFESLKMGSLECFLIYKLVYNFSKLPAGREAAFEALMCSVASAASGRTSTFISIIKWAFGLVFSGVELIYNCATLNNCETVQSKSLRKRSKEIRAHSENMKKELDDINSLQKKKLMDFAKEQCQEKVVRTWLENKEKSEVFLKLFKMLCFLHEELNKQKMKIDRENIDITFVAHGAIENPLIPASCLLPGSTFKDVVLYSPWNCALYADAAYGIATGRLELKHRVFYCGDEENCKVKHDGHQPTKLPADWNSMKKAEKQMIPTISVQPLRIPEDGAWKRIEFLQDKHGRPGKNRILIPFILPGESRDFEVPFFVVTLALSLVLCFSNVKATVHLAACLGRCEKISDPFKKALNDQYSYTIDETGMKPSEEMLDGSFLSKLFEKLFGRKSSGMSCTIL